MFGFNSRTEIVKFKIRVNRFPIRHVSSAHWCYEIKTSNVKITRLYKKHLPDKMHYNCCVGMLPY